MRGVRYKKAGPLESFFFAFFLNSRTIGTVLATIIGGLLLAHKGGGLSFFVLIPLGWIWGLFLGAKIHFLLWFFRSRGKAPRTSLNWDTGAGLVLALTAGLTLLFDGLQLRIGLFGILWVFFSLAYGFNKLSCWRYGCCGWSRDLKKAKWIRAVPLPLLEAGISLGAGAFLAASILGDSHSLFIAMVFIVSHLLLRTVNYWGRYPLSPPVVDPSKASAVPLD